MAYSSLMPDGGSTPSTRFYTRRARVPLKAGQIVAFTPGRGYYAKPGPTGAGSSSLVKRKTTTTVPGLYAPRSLADLERIASSDVEADIGAQISPLQAQVGRLGTRREDVLRTQEGMFGGLLPYVQASAQRVGTTYKEGLDAERGIFNAAQARLSQLKGERAAQAQALAQQIGAPVPLADFTEPVAGAEGQMQDLQGASLLSATGAGQAAVDEAEAFAGKVFPLIRAEEHAKTEKQYSDDVRELENEINRIKGTAVGAKRTRLNELVASEREYELATKQQALEELKAQRDWQTAQKTLAQQQESNALDWANLMGYRDKKWRDKKGKVHTSRVWTLAGKQLSEQQRHSIAQEGIDRDTLTATTANQAAARKQALTLNQQKQNIANKSAAVQLINAYMTPGQQTVKWTDWQEVTQAQIDAMDTPPKVYPGAGGKLYIQVPRNDIIKTDITKNPSLIYHNLIGQGIPRAIAVQAVKNRFQLPKNWKPGMSPREWQEKTRKARKFPGGNKPPYEFQPPSPWINQ